MIFKKVWLKLVSGINSIGATSAILLFYSGAIQYHSSRIFSSSAVNLMSFTASTGGASALVKAHGYGI